MKYLVTIGFSLLSLSIAQAEIFTGATKLSDKTLDEIVVMGEADLTNIKATSVTVTGTLLFNRVDVTGDVNVLGPIKEESTDLICKELNIVGPISAKNIKCAGINVLGSVKLENIEASGNMNIAGSLEIKKAKLKNLNVTSNEIYLEDVSVNDITIDKIPLSSDPQKLYLKGTTAVTGSIKFESGKGIVILEDKATSGKITGGSLQIEAPAASKN